MARAFDPGLIEFHLHTDTGDQVCVYKIGGGTLGRSYDGLWGYRHTCDDVLIASGENLRTGTPKTHQDVALLVIDFHDLQE